MNDADGYEITNVEIIIIITAKTTDVDIPEILVVVF